MLRTLLALSTGGLFTFGFWFQQDAETGNQRTVEVQATVSADEIADPTKMVAEMRELRTQLAFVVGPNHPAVRKIDSRILQMSATGSLAENFFGPRVVHGMSIAPGQAGFGIPSEALLGRIDGGGPRGSSIAMGPDGIPVELNMTRSTSTSPLSWNVAPFTPALERNGGFGEKLAELRKKWSESDEASEARQTVLDELKTAITEEFDTDLAKRRQQLEDLEKKLSELRKHIEKRENSRDEFVTILTKYTEMEWEGISLQSGRREGMFPAPTTRPARSIPPNLLPASADPVPPGTTGPTAPLY